MKIQKKGNYILILNADDEVIFNAHAMDTDYNEVGDKVVIYEKGGDSKYQNPSISDLPANFTDENGDAFPDGVIDWLQDNTGFNSASGGRGAEILALQEGKTDKGGYEGTAQDLKDEIDGVASGYRGDLQIADTPTLDGIYTPT